MGLSVSLGVRGGCRTCAHDAVVYAVWGRKVGDVLPRSSRPTAAVPHIKAGIRRVFGYSRVASGAECEYVRMSVVA